MAAPKPRTGGDTLRLAADRLYALADRYDAQQRTQGERQELHDQIEVTADEIRSVVRGSSRIVCPPKCMVALADGSISAGW
ncbi:hypothetical protein GCM10011380_08720 [Sphingomonas metalli]|uniref:Uncharacterized protein n=1 Tax=Sphingomonas metalli TaxID=1779358 RepID=A0A916SZZ1_9SPHN|nr:hypothetical protein [Sphingomonas metalli]GGB21415.1 hypothetical protein GCM10011380_08720 [Sphingomonas metalli]